MGPRSQEVGVSGTEIPGGWGEGGKTVYLTLHSLPALEWLYIEMDSDDSHFNASLIVRSKVTRKCL